MSADDQTFNALPGDDGMTQLANGFAVEKDSPTIDATGEVDELASIVRLLIAFAPPGQTSAFLLLVADDLRALGDQIMRQQAPLLSKDRVRGLDSAAGRLNSAAEAFHLERGQKSTQFAAVAGLARSVCRRVERRLINWAHLDHRPDNYSHIYLNHLAHVLERLQRL